MKDAAVDKAVLDLAAGLCAYLVDNQVSNPRVSGLRRLTGGSSHATWAFDLVQGDPPGAEAVPLILRSNFGDVSLDMTPEAEFRLLRWLHDEGLPVARPWLCAAKDSPLGAPFVISQRVDGSDLRKIMAKSGGIMDRRATGTALVALQARLHALDLTHCPGGIFSAPADAVHHEVTRWTGLLLEADGGRPHPLARAAAGWLRAHVPAIDQPCLVHGDFKANNILWTAAGVPVLLDWELAHLGDPLEDLAWTMLWATQDDLVSGMLSPVDYIAAYEAHSGRSVDHKRLFFWQLFTIVKLSWIMQTGSGTALAPEDLGVSHAMLSRGVACLEAAMADYLAATLPSEVRP